jgi:hypothetical protein
VDALENLARSMGIRGTFRELCQNKTLTDVLFEKLNETGKEEKLMSYELIKGNEVGNRGNG